MSNSLKDQYATSPLYGVNASAVEALYEQYLLDAETVPAAWRDYFETLGDSETEIAHSAIRKELLETARNGTRRKTRIGAPSSNSAAASGE